MKLFKPKKGIAKEAIGMPGTIIGTLRTMI